MLVTGASLYWTAILLGLLDFIFLAYLLLSLPVFSLLSLAWGLPRLQATRSFRPSVVAVGEETVVSVQLRTVPGRQTGGLPVRKSDRQSGRLPGGLNWVEQSVTGLDLPLGGPAGADLECTLTPRSRGIFHCESLRLQRSDPFGFARREWSAGGSADLVVTPPVIGLADTANTRGGTASHTEGLRRAVRSPSGFLAREYQPGDPFNRVNWSATARRGEIMVREDDAASSQAARIVLDLAGQTPQSNATAADVESAVMMTAALGAHLLQSGHQLELVRFTPDALRSTAPAQTSIRRLFRGAPEQQSFLEDLAAVGSPETDAAGTVSKDPGMPVPTFLITTAAEASVRSRLESLVPVSRPGTVFLIGAAPTQSSAQTQARLAEYAGELGWTLVLVAASSDIEAAWAQVAFLEGRRA
jgi:uncharacterized protein (DUF58 family)